jgi:hypothetical protein
VDETLALVHTDWARNRLTASGPAEQVTRFQAAAYGARLYSPMAGHGPDARAPARELCEQPP